MTNKHAPPKRSGKQQYSIGTLVVMFLIVLVYWWLTGSLPGSENADTVANAPVVATNTPAQSAAATGVKLEDEATEVAVTTVFQSVGIATAEATASPVLTVEATVAATEEEEAPPAISATAIPEPTATTPPKPTAAPTNPPRAGPSGMVVITLDTLPPEAVETIDLIFAGGPFPFDRDGVTFQNREGLLPNKPRGYYSEYTVITPGSRDRGARRIIAGANDEIYYTDDHYDSFYWVEVP